MLGLTGIARNPSVLAAIDPRHAIAFMCRNRGSALLVLGGVFLCITGGEALYADMGHIGRIPIRRAWYLIVLPALLLSYAGQTACDRGAVHRRQSVLPAGTGVGDLSAGGAGHRGHDHRQPGHHPRLMFTAFRINSMDMRTIITLRRVSTPTTPMAKSARLRMQIGFCWNHQTLLLAITTAPIIATSSRTDAISNGSM